ncbi:MAG: hypothetical protein EON47_08520, partial [Acetobacteraceae bacterium]
MSMMRMPSNGRMARFSLSWSSDYGRARRLAPSCREALGETTSVTASAAASPRLFAVPDFRRLWCVGLIVFLVRWLELLAVSLFVYQATGSAFLVTMMGMLRILPMGLFGALLGAMAERVEARTALLGIVVSSLLVSLALAVLAWLGMLAVWHLAVASFL